MQHRLVVIVFTRFLVRWGMEQAGEGLFVEQTFRDQLLLLEEPDKDQPGEQADERHRWAALRGRVIGVVQRLARGEGDIRIPMKCPVVPVSQFLVELLVEDLDVQRCHPGFVEIVEAGRGEFLADLMQCHAFQNADMGCVGCAWIDVLDDGNLAVDHVARGIALVATTVDHSQRQQVFQVMPRMPEEQDDRHWKQPVHFSGDARQAGT